MWLTTHRREVNRLQHSDMLARSPVESARTETVIAVVAIYGKGVENDPMRPVTEYWSMEGKLLAINDPIMDCVYAGPRHLPQ